MKYVIVYTDSEIVFGATPEEAQVEDNTITYYPEKGYYCKVFDNKEEYLKNKQVIEEALVQKRLDVECVSCYKEWLDKMSVTYSTKLLKDELKKLVADNITLSNYPADKKNWVDTVGKIKKEAELKEK